MYTCSESSAVKHVYKKLKAGLELAVFQSNMEENLEGYL